MSRLTRRLLCVGVAAATGFLPGTAGAETCQLRLKRIDHVSSAAGRLLEYLLTSRTEQSFSNELGAERPDMEAEFRKVVKKQPNKYECKQPFRCVARLGDGRYAMVFDSTDIDKKGYNRLYLDLNGNGDLTDDGVVRAGSGGLGSMWHGSTATNFPMITMSIKAGGEEFQYRFDVSAVVYGSGDRRYVQASLRTGVLREGEITLDGKKRVIYALDRNSNGRFDDLYTVDRETTSGDGRVWPTGGDMLLIDPDRATSEIRWYDPTVNERLTYVAKIVGLNGQFYDLSISATGDKITLEPSKAPVGYIVNPNASFRAMVYGDAGVLRVGGTKGSPTALPEGRWRLLSYTIDLTNTSQPAAEPGEKIERGGTLVSRLIWSAGGSGPKPTLVAASATKDCEPVTVKKGETVEMRFGPPYTPRVRVEEWARSKDRKELTLALVGSAGEICNDLRVKGDRPEAPTFAIVAPDGEIIERGKFDYG